MWHLVSDYGHNTNMFQSPQACSWDTVINYLSVTLLTSFVLQTEMTTAEMELDHNTNFDWNRIQESGKDTDPLYGPGYTGLVNLGNR